MATESGFPHLRTDVIRKTLAGLPATARGPDSLYAAERDRATYAALGRSARAAAPTGVIVDGTFRRRDDRDAFSAELAATPLVIECVAPEQTVLARAAARERAPQRVSDAGVAVVSGQLGRFEPLDELPARRHVILRTDRPVGELVSELGPLVAQRAIASRPR